MLERLEGKLSRAVLRGLEGSNAPPATRLAMLIGYAVSGEPTLRAFCERAQPFASAFMALFGRADFPTPPTLSRYLAVLDQPCVEALRALFLEDLLARTPFGTPPGGLWDRLGGLWLLMDVDGTKQAARQRALPVTEDLPPAHRRFDRVCAPGHLGRKRGEVVRTRTTILQAHTHQFLGMFGNPGNGHYRDELKQARTVIATYAHALAFPLSHVVIRLDGLYGDRVSAVFWPRTTPPAASPLECAAPVSEAERVSPPMPVQEVALGDWPRCQLRRTFVQLMRTQTVLVSFRNTETLVHAKPHAPSLSTRAERARWRLSWEKRLARNARPPTAPPIEITLHGLPAPFIQSLGFPVRQAA